MSVELDLASCSRYATQPFQSPPIVPAGTPRQAIATGGIARMPNGNDSQKRKYTRPVMIITDYSSTRLSGLQKVRLELVRMSMTSRE